MNQAGHSYKLRLNQFGDIRQGDEFRMYVHGHTGSCMKQRLGTQRKEEKQVGAVPTSIDWTDNNGKNYVTSVKNQGQCGHAGHFLPLDLLNLELQSLVKGSLPYLNNN
jgi:hypothetical protein